MDGCQAGRGFQRGAITAAAALSAPRERKSAARTRWLAAEVSMGRRSCSWRRLALARAAGPRLFAFAPKGAAPSSSRGSTRSRGEGHPRQCQMTPMTA
jgi:hypothetical protein